jgi:hypothetical protein
MKMKMKHHEARRLRAYHEANRKHPLPLETGWGVYHDDDGRTKHLVPKGDSRRHILDLDCWCHPWWHPECQATLVHVAKDGRENWEPNATPRPQ